MKTKINEIFYSLQMEGSYIGYPAVFIRFTGCNLDCDFCDTRYALKEGSSMEIDEIFSIVKTFNAKRIIFTGGEPALYDGYMNQFMTKYDWFDYFLETNATIFIEKSIKKFKHIVASPKMSAINRDVLSKFKEQANSIEFKFLVDKADDFKQIEKLSIELELFPLTLQPIFDNNHTLDVYINKTKSLIESFKKSLLANRNARLIIQNQKVIYNEERGV